MASHAPPVCGNEVQVYSPSSACTREPLLQRLVALEKAHAAAAERSEALEKATVAVSERSEALEGFVCELQSAQGQLEAAVAAKATSVTEAVYRSAALHAEYSNVFTCHTQYLEDKLEAIRQDAKEAQVMATHTTWRTLSNSAATLMETVSGLDSSAELFKVEYEMLRGASTLEAVAAPPGRSQRCRQVRQAKAGLQQGTRPRYSKTPLGNDLFPIEEAGAEDPIQPEQTASREGFTMQLASAVQAPSRRGRPPRAARPAPAPALSGLTPALRAPPTPGF